jgi:FAD/FMN-containing dehydrogenase
LHRSNDGLVICNGEQNSDMLHATIGGLGLTGVIAWADIQLKRVSGPWIEAEQVPFRSLNSFFDLSRESDGRFEYTVAWLDCFAGKNARGIFFRGNHAAEGGREILPKHGAARGGLTVPFALPGWVLNRYSIKAFNAAYYNLNSAKAGTSTVSYNSFFYPLDSIRRWNLLYGRNGFLQYQCVIPENNIEAIGELLERIAQSGMGSFLGVLKQFGTAPAAGMLSFPRPGITLALDFAMRGERTLKLVQSLDEIVQQSGGALYPAKDARMSPSMFEASFPRWRNFISYVDPKMSSSLWRRVTGALEP